MYAHCAGNNNVIAENGSRDHFAGGGKMVSARAGGHRQAGLWAASCISVAVVGTRWRAIVSL